MDNPKRARSWKRRIQPRVGLQIVEPVLYSTHFLLVQFTLNASCHHDVKRKHQQNPLAVDLPGEHWTVAHLHQSLSALLTHTGITFRLSSRVPPIKRQDEGLPQAGVGWLLRKKALFCNVVPHESSLETDIQTIRVTDHRNVSGKLCEIAFFTGLSLSLDFDCE